MRHTTFKKMMAEAFYGELAGDEKKEFNLHLMECAECTRAYKKMSTTLAVMHQRQQPEPDASYWNNYWRRLEPELRRNHASPSQQSSWIVRLRDAIHVEPRFVFVAACALLLVVIGAGIGRFLLQPDVVPPEMATTGQPSQDDVFRAEQVKRTGEYLDRSRTLLLGIVHLDTTGSHGTDLSRQKTISRELVDEARALQISLKSPEQARLRKLVADLEVLMIQIANLEAQYDDPAVELVRSGVSRSAILLKINLEQMQMDTPVTSQQIDKPNS